MRTLIFFFAILVIFSNCNNEKNSGNKKNSFTLEPTTDSIYIKLGENELNRTSLNQYFSENDTNYLAVLNMQRHSIYIYNLDNEKLLKEIVVEHEGTNAFSGLFGYVVKNLDTIVLISNIPPRIGIINNQGAVIKKISFERDMNNKVLFPAVPLSGTKGFLIGDSLYIMQDLYIPDYNGNVTSDVQKQANVSIIVDLKSGLVKSLPLSFPTELVGKDIFSMDNFWELGYQNCFVYNFNIMDNLFVTKNFSEFKKTPIKTDYDFKLPQKMYKLRNDFTGLRKYKMKTDRIWDIKYDKYRECYYIFVRKRETDIKQDEFKHTNPRPNFFIIILDKTFSHLGDVHFPQNTYSTHNMFITQKGIYISEDHIDNPSYSEDAMKFRLFKLEKL